jgi:hypothetical protein
VDIIFGNAVEVDGDCGTYWHQLQFRVGSYDTLNGHRLEIHLVAEDCKGQDITDEVTFLIDSMNAYAGPSNYSFSEIGEGMLIYQGFNYKFGLEDQLFNMGRIYYEAPPCANVNITVDGRLAVVINGSTFCYYDYDNTVLSDYTTDGECFEGNIEIICNTGVYGPFPDVDVTLYDSSASPIQIDDTDITDINGDYCLAICEKNQPTGVGIPNHLAKIQPSYNIDTFCGIDIDDYTLLDNYLNSNICLPSKASYFAADIDQDGDIDNSDLSFLLNMVNGTFSTSHNYWGFIQKDAYNASTMTWNGTCSVPVPFAYDDFALWDLNFVYMTDPDLDFYGFKLGDIDGSCHNCDSLWNGGGPSEESLLVYPNPARDEILIENSKNSIIEVFDSNGLLIDVNRNKTERRRINISGYIPGIYILRSSDGRHKKFIKQ